MPKPLSSRNIARKDMAASGVSTSVLNYDTSFRQVSLEQENLTDIYL